MLEIGGWDAWLDEYSERRLDGMTDGLDFGQKMYIVKDRGIESMFKTHSRNTVWSTQ